MDAVNNEAIRSELEGYRPFLNPWQIGTIREQVSDTPQYISVVLPPWPNGFDPREVR